MDDYIKILTSSSIIVNRIVFLLKEKNISTRLRDNVESGRLAGFGVPQNDVELFVRKSEYQKAKQVIDGSDIVLSKE
tara:strand:- start:392 stop:622 length:231 start_codon:yes stop_codon:yes gene_type:complete